MSGWGVRAIALLLVVASYWGAYEHGRSVERAEAGKASAQRDSGDRLAEVLGERGERQEEQRRAAAHEERRASAHKQQAIAIADAAGADAAGRRLHDAATDLATSVSCSSPDPAVAARGEAARRAAMVLSDLLKRSVDTNRDLAAAYDGARIAGLACEGAYNALIKPPG